ncbi:MAG TPA: energy transducer TonB [Hymenobacter sp.]|jgi:outer membrane biosynthesis protein TonB|uniref:energy transducer TonB n=1 Tax=Hymenobacter sp. TaxID=1898978 RepID=UPI002EDA817C
MKYLSALLFGCLVSSTPSFAQDLVNLKDPNQSQQTAPPQSEADKVYTYVEQMPQLPGGGGNSAIVTAIQRATKYPPLALRNQVEGRVFVSFVVTSVGDVTSIRS